MTLAVCKTAVAAVPAAESIQWTESERGGGDSERRKGGVRDAVCTKARFRLRPKSQQAIVSPSSFRTRHFDISLESIWLMGNNGPLCTFPIPVCMIRGSNRNEIERFVRELSGNKDMEWCALHRHSWRSPRIRHHTPSHPIPFPSLEWQRTKIVDEYYVRHFGIGRPMLICYSFQPNGTGLLKKLTRNRCSLFLVLACWMLSLSISVFALIFTR